MSNNDLVNLLRSGQQTPVKLSFNNQDSFEKLAGRVSVQLETDSIALLEAFSDRQFLKNSGFSESTALGMYIPNTYEFFWNTSAEEFRNRMLAEYRRFWNNQRTELANAKGLTQNEVITLASIVQKETAKVGERKRVALASVLAWNPKTLILDEPTIGQDHRQKENLRQFIIQMQTQQKTVVIVTHDVEFVAECNPRVLLMKDGKILAIKRNIIG